MSLLNRRMATAVASAAALLVLGGAPAAQAAGPLPMFAAALNAGTVSTGIGRLGLIGQGIFAVLPPEAVSGESSGTAVAGIQFQAREADPTAETRAATGDSIVSALLNAGTTATGIGPTGVVGSGIFAVR
jgi:hypothetical protein